MDRKDVISDIKECYEKHGYFNGAILDSDDEFCCRTTLQNKFGSVSNACDEAGVPHNNKPQKKEKVSIKCQCCGNVRKVYPYRAEKEFSDGTSQNCKQCMDKKQTVLCSWCGNELTRHNYRIGRSENFFCDHSCFGSWRSENIVGEKHPRYDDGPILEMGHNWSSIREDVIHRDDEKCVSCDMSREKHIEKFNRDINVHHIVPRKEFIESENKSIDDANEMDNLKTMCISCHQKEESKQ